MTIDINKICGYVAEILAGPSGPRWEVKFYEGPYYDGPYYAADLPEGWVCRISVNGIIVFMEYHFGEDAKEITRSELITSIFTHGIDAARKSLEHLHQQIQSKEE